MPRLTTLKPRLSTLDTRRVHSASTSTDRIRGRKLLRIRERVLSANPLCAHCLAKGIYRAATEVDHIVALENGGKEDEHDDSNRQALCKDCHKEKTAADNARARGLLSPGA